MRENRSSFLSVPAALENLKNIRDHVEVFARAVGFPDSVIYDLVLAVDEAATNIVIHGYKIGHAPSAEQTAPGMIEVQTEYEEPMLRVTLRDQAPPFDPTAAEVEDELPPLSERLPGGLGIFLMRKTMDEIHYRRTPDGWNELTLAVLRPAHSKED
jgi:serine/threonine-protein kinase RsbW